MAWYTTPWGEQRYYSTTPDMGELLMSMNMDPWGYSQGLPSGRAVPPFTPGTTGLGGPFTGGSGVQMPTAEEIVQNLLVGMLGGMGGGLPDHGNQPTAAPGATQGATNAIPGGNATPDSRARVGTNIPDPQSVTDAIRNRAMLAAAGTAAGVGTAKAVEAIGGGDGGSTDTTGGTTGQLDITDPKVALILAIAKQLELAGQMQPFAASSLAKGLSGFDPVMDYWRRLLSGDRGTALEALGPQISALDEMYKGATKTSSELMPRGGGRSATMAELPYRHMSDVWNLLSGSRGKAAEQLGAVSGDLARTGTQLYGGAISGLGGAASNAAQMQQLQQWQSAQRFQQMSDMARGIYEIGQKTGVWDKIGGGIKDLWRKVFGGSPDDVTWGSGPG